MKKIWLSLFSGIIFGLVISLYVYRGEEVFFYIPYVHPNETVYVLEHNFDVTVGAVRKMVICSVAVYVVLFLREKVRKTPQQ
ncbi:hypothetical protein M3689_02320 [Alkalihalophilus marmarensis]|jgi:hypothetical protein|uniref:Uncharacterized protein n=1 Tax=Alkalihalophilus marmarensis DSM 21297 TaxID=1188261 RepID=U6STR1_9BACI|nr:hypothetical protein [Alkalihalophilus marmarensis]ERN54041.1 hypothetical protein A33I_08710 [Alkalihalophilus marmarensis DSM 21297]MCM3488138.1 hypothetical protein [Alkalihalophilus marmarensis]